MTLAERVISCDSPNRTRACNDACSMNCTATQNRRTSVLRDRVAALGLFSWAPRSLLVLHQWQSAPIVQNVYHPDGRRVVGLRLAAHRSRRPEWPKLTYCAMRAVNWRFASIIRSSKIRPLSVQSGTIDCQRTLVGTYG
jgi:hypothetical protein